MCKQSDEILSTGTGSWQGCPVWMASERGFRGAHTNSSFNLQEKHKDLALKTGAARGYQVRSGTSNPLVQLPVAQAYDG